jgi:hypothetical protein
VTSTALVARETDRLTRVDRFGLSARMFMASIATAMAGLVREVEWVARGAARVLAMSLLCHRLRRYLAADLLALYGDSPAYEPIFNCGRCGRLLLEGARRHPRGWRLWALAGAAAGQAGRHTDVADGEVGRSLAIGL